MIDIGSYKFKMQSLLDYRTQLETEARDKMVVLKSEMEGQEEICTRLAKRLSECTKAQVVLDIQSMKMRHLYMEKLRSDITTQKKKADGISEELGRAQMDLIKTRKDKKIIETLKNKEREAFLKASEKREQKENDELTLLRFAK